MAQSLFIRLQDDLRFFSLPLPAILVTLPCSKPTREGGLRAYHVPRTYQRMG